MIYLDDNTNTWAIVELMGRKIVAGLVSKSVELGPPMLRIDVPATSAYPGFTQFYGETSLYCVTFVSEEVAQRAAEQMKTNPVSVYVPDLITREQLNETVKRYEKRLEQLRALPAGGHDDDEDDGRGSRQERDSEDDDD